MNIRNLLGFGSTKETTPAPTKPQKYQSKLVGTPEKWRRLRKTIWNWPKPFDESHEAATEFSRDKVRKRGTLGLVWLLVILTEIAITPLGILLLIANNTKNAMMVDKKNHSEGCKSSEAWPWLAMWVGMVVLGIMVKDYQTGGMIQRGIQASIDETVESITTESPEEPQVRFREFGDVGGNNKVSEPVGNNFITKMTTCTTEDAAAEETVESEVEETEVAPVTEVEVEEIETALVTEAEVEKEPEVAYTRVVGEDVFEFDENGEIIWHEEDWNIIPEDAIPVVREASFE